MKRLAVAALTFLIAVHLHAEANIDQPPANTTACVGTSVTFVVLATPSDPMFVLEYSWVFNGQTILDATNSTYTIPSATDANVGGYYVTVYERELLSEINSGTVTLTVHDPPVVTINSETICAGQSTLLTASSAASNPTYSWTPGGETTAAIMVSPESSTIYTCNITDGTTGCSGPGSGTVTVHALTSSTGPGNQTVDEGEPVLFNTLASGTGPFTYIWRQNGNVVQGPDNNSSFSIAATATSDSGSIQVEVSGACGSITNGATLTINTADPPPPNIISAYSLDGARIKLLWDKALDFTTATDASNYQVTDAVVDSAQLLPDRSGISNIVILAISGLSNSGFEVGIAPGHGIADLFGDIQTGNPLASGNVFAFGSGLTDDVIIGTLLDPVEVGSISINASQQLQIVAGGSDIGGIADAFNYVYGLRTNDFDLKVRVSGLDPRDSLSKAGFVVRESLSPGSPAVSAVITPQGLALDGSGPGANDYESGIRSDLDGDTTEWDRDSRPPNPVPYTNAWIRLRRSGTTFIAFWGTNGTDWMEWAKTESALPDIVLVGLGTSSHNNDIGQTTTAVFEDFGVILPPTVETPPLDQTVIQSATATFSLQVSGEAPFSYQWRFNTDLLTDQTNATLTLDNVQPSDAGTYDVIVENIVGSAISAPAELVVITPPLITTGPVDQTVECHTMDVTFTVAAESTVPVTYQWYDYNDLPMLDQTNSTLTILNVRAADMGAYKVFVSNIAGSTPASAVLTVTDTIVPILTLLGADLIEIECHASFADPGATAADSCAGDLTSAIVVTGTVDVNSPGTYVRHYNVSDPSGNAATELTRTVMVVDTTKPIITLSGNSSMTIECHTSFSDPGATAADSCAGDLTSAILLTGTVDPNAPGVYTLHYNVSDPGGNHALEKTRTVHVVDTTPPSIACPSDIRVCTSSNSATVSFSLPAAVDLCDGAATVSASPVSGSIFPLGTNEVQLTATDASGNTNSCTFTVTVFKATSPVLAVIGYSSGAFSFSFPTENGCSYVVEFKESLDDPTWTTLRTVVGDGSVMTVSDSEGSGANRFYQLRVQ